MVESKIFCRNCAVWEGVLIEMVEICAHQIHVHLECPECGGEWEVEEGELEEQLDSIIQNCEKILEGTK